MACQGEMLTVPVSADFPSPLELTLTKSVPSGTLLRLRASGVMMLRSLKVVAVSAYCDRDAKTVEVPLDVVQHFSWEAMQQHWMKHLRTLALAAVEVPRDLKAGTRIKVHCKPGALARELGSPAFNVVAGLTWRLLVGRVKTLEAVDFAPVALPLTIRFVAGPTDRLDAMLKSDGHVLVQQFDAFGNPTHPQPGEDLTVSTGELALQVSPTPSVAVTAVPLSPKGGGAEPLPLRVRVEDRAGRSAESHALPVASDGTPIYFGEIHWHTDFSGDGQRTLVEALTSARDELGLDFAGSTDHLSPDGTYIQRLPIEQVEICRRFDDPGQFCTLLGAELSGRYGHVNLYAADAEAFLAIVRRFPHELLPVWREDPDRYPLDVLAALCPEGKAMIVPHHTNMDSSASAGVVRSDGRSFWCALHWPLVTPLLRQGLRLVEIVQNHGAFETEMPDALWRVRWGRLGGSVRTGLLRGHRLGFVGGSDNHMGWPTRLDMGGGYGGLTAVQASRLDGAVLFDALYRRHCYATSGARIVVDATLNGLPMGSELSLPPDAERVFRISVRGTAPLAAVQIISLGAILADLPVGDMSPDLELRWSDDRPGRPLDDVYYYIRIRQSDGHCAWLSPWWVDRA